MAASDEEVAEVKHLSVEQVRLLRQTRGTTNDTLKATPEPVLRRALRRLSYPDLPRARERLRVQIARSDDGKVRVNGLARALREVRSLRKRVPKSRVGGMPTSRSTSLTALNAPPTAGLAQSGWQWLGPGNVGGRTRAVVVHPVDPLQIWVGSAAGGVWKSADGGATWMPVDDFMANLAIGCLVMDATDFDRLYAGTGEGFANLDAIRGAGIFRTTDGTTWKQLPGTVTPDFQAVNRLALSRDGTVLLAATPKGLLRSTDPDRKTWSKVVDVPMADVKFHPTKSTHAVAGSLATGEAYYSTNGGLAWKGAGHATPWNGRVELTYAVKDPAIIYASVQMEQGEIWASLDGGKTYQQRQTKLSDGTSPQYLGDQGWYDNAIWAGDPTDENLVIVGGIDLWRSADGGNTLVPISTWWASGSAHADHHAIVSHPAYDGTTTRTVFFGNDGGIFKADDVLAVGVESEPPYVQGWTSLVNDYGVTQFYGAAGHPGSGKIVGGAQDNGTVCFDPANGAQAWKTIFGGDGGYCAADPTDPAVFYGEYVYLNIHRNLDGGTTDDTQGDRYISGQFWNPTRRDWDWKPTPYRIDDARNQKALFIAPFVLDPNDPNCILGGGLSLWRTNDAKAPNTLTTGPEWRAIKGSVGERISAVAVARGNSDVVWVGHELGMVFRSTNATNTQPQWQRMDGVGPKPLVAKRFCTGITIDPGDHAVVYVTFGGYLSSNIWATKDGGATWTDRGGSLPAAPVRALEIHPRNPKYLYVGTEVGVFASDNAGLTWSPTNEGPTSCSVDDLFWMGEVLVSVTHGRGMFQIDLSNV